jgi:hypothetical protein
MKTTKRILVMLAACAITALIYMAGPFPATSYRDSIEERTMQQPEILPAVQVDLMTFDRIFR